MNIGNKFDASEIVRKFKSRVWCNMASANIFWSTSPQIFPFLPLHTFHQRKWVLPKKLGHWFIFPTLIQQQKNLKQLVVNRVYDHVKSVYLLVEVTIKRNQKNFLRHGFWVLKHCFWTSNVNFFQWKTQLYSLMKTSSIYNINHSKIGW